MKRVIVILSLSVIVSIFPTLLVQGNTKPGSAALYSSGPTVNFVGAQRFARLSNQQSIAVHANDPNGISRIELLVDQTPIGSVTVSASPQETTVYFAWDTTSIPNGKHLLEARAYNIAGAAQAVIKPVKVYNFTITTPTGNTIAINPYVKYQIMNGWEAVAEAGQFYSPAWNLYKTPILDMAANDLGINRIRLEVTSGAENPTDYFAQWRAGQISESQYNSKRYEIINDDADPNHINPAGFKWTQLDSTINELILPLRQRLQARGESLWVNLNYVDFGSSSFEHKGNPSEYAEFVLATYRHMQNVYGFVPDSWEVVLEPDTPTAGWSPTQVALALKAAGDSLSADGFHPRFTAPSVTNATNAVSYIDQISQTPGAMPYVGEFSYHRYGGASDTVLQQISDRTILYGKQAGMLEWIGADYNTLHQDIKMGLNSSWQQFTLAGPASWGPDTGDRYFLIDDSIASAPVITVGSRTKFLRQYFKFIRCGAQRIQALSGNPTFDPLAFINRNGTYTVVIKAGSGGSFSVLGLPPGNYGMKFTTANQYDFDIPDAQITGGQPLSANIPAAGVITVYGK